jgi:hypothetical protein
LRIWSNRFFFMTTVPPPLPPPPPALATAACAPTSDAMAAWVSAVLSISACISVAASRALVKLGSISNALV